MTAQTVPERLRAWAKNRKHLGLDHRLLITAAYEIERAKRERDEAKRELWAERGVMLDLTETMRELDRIAEESAGVIAASWLREFIAKAVSDLEHQQAVRRAHAETPLTRESGLALIEEANRWERLYNHERACLAKVDALLADPSGSPLDAINLARKVIHERSE